MPCDILPSTPPSSGNDHLSALPHDLCVEILSYLMLPGIRNDFIDLEFEEEGSYLKQLALVSKTWRVQVEAFRSHKLLVWKQRVEDNIDRKRGWWVEWRQLPTFTSCARMSSC